MFFHCRFVKFVYHPFYDPQGILGAFSKARAEAVTIHIRNQLGLAIYYLHGAFRACRNALPAAVAALGIYFHNFAFNFHGVTPYELSLVSQQHSAKKYFLCQVFTTVSKQ
jgi:hypothetical protein